jgi:hypothetical protein
MRLHPNLVVILNRRIRKNPTISPEAIASIGKPGITVVNVVILLVLLIIWLVLII